MAHPKLPIKRLVSAEVGASAKRRKIRKGTASCWECKRRKTKCIFSGSTESVCEGCTRRGTHCVTQEFSEDPSNQKQHFGDRLGRVERLLDGVFTKVNTGSDTTRELAPRTDGQLTPRVFQNFENVTQTNLANLGQLEHKEDGCRSGDEALTAHQFIQPQYHKKISPVLVKCPTEPGLIQALLSAWPSQSDLEVILNAPITTSGLYYGLISIPHSRFFANSLLSTRTLLRMPQACPHPVFYARSLLILAILLQTATMSIIQDLTDKLNTTPQNLMTNAVETVRRLITSNDDLVTTVEGIECIMMESRYYNNAGNLRRACHSIRRALTAAQMIGLDRDAESPLIKFLDPETRDRIIPSHMWLNIVQTDRYLSLMLGLPPGSYDESFTAPSLMEKCTSTERVQRNLALAAGRILQRSQSDLHNIRTTQEIDTLLLENAALLPPQWWLPPNFDPEAKELNVLNETIRISIQLTHYHLVQRLHLPYLLHSVPANASSEYSKTAAITASRELLSRYVSLYCLQPEAISFCRGVEILAFIACTALCLGHVDLRLQQDRDIRDDQGSQGGGAVYGCLAHQRLSDRGLMERMLQGVECMASEDPKDAIAARIAMILRQLLDVEADVAGGAPYTRGSSSGGERDDLMCSGEKDEDGGALNIFIPHLGMIKFERGRISRAAVDASSSNAIAGLPHQNEEIVAGKQVLDEAIGVENGASDLFGVEVQDAPWHHHIADSGEEWAFQGIELSLFDTLFPISDAQEPNQ